MNSLIIVLNILLVAGMVTSAVFAVHMENLLLSAAALGLAGFFAAAEYLLLRAPVAALAEANVGAVLTPFLLIIVLKKINRREDK